MSHAARFFLVVVAAFLCGLSVSAARAYELPVHTLVIEQKYLDTLDSPNNLFDDTYYPASFSGEGFATSCEVRYRGGTSRRYPKKSWKIKFPDAKNIFGTDTLNLNANYIDESMMRNGLTMQLFSFLGYPSSRTRFVNLIVNGTVRGLFQVVEDIDETFLDYNNRKSGSIYKGVKQDASLAPLVNYQEYFDVYEKKMGDESDYSDFQLLLNKVFYWTADDFKKNIAETVNVENILNHYAVMFAIASFDNMTKNFYIYNNPQTEKWELFPWDNDATYGLNWEGVYYNNFSSITKGTYLDHNVLFQRLMEYEEFSSDFLEKVERIRTDGFSYLHAQIDSTYSTIRNDFYADQSKRITNEEFDAAIPRLHEFLNERALHLTDLSFFNRKKLGEFYCSNPYPGQSNPTVTFRAAASSADAVTVYYSTDLDYFTFNDSFTQKTLTLLDDGLHDDGAAGDLVYGNSLQLPSGSNAYIPFTFNLKNNGWFPANGMYRASCSNSNTFVINTMNPTVDVFQNLRIHGVAKVYENYAIELINISDRQLDISFCHVRGRNYYLDFEIPEGTIIKGNGRVVVATNAETGQTLYPGETILPGLYYSISEEDSLSLLSPVYSTIQSFYCERYLNHDENLSEVVINEINYKSSSKFDPGDWVEFYNPGDTSVDISGWKLTDDNSGHVFTIPPYSAIAADGYYIVCADSARFTTLFPEVTSWCGDMGFGLGSDGDSVKLFNQNGVLVDEVNYTNSSPWPDEPDGHGETLSLINPGSNNSLPASWAASSRPYGTPGKTNTFNDEQGKFTIIAPSRISAGSTLPVVIMVRNEDLTLDTTVSETVGVTIDEVSFSSDITLKRGIGSGMLPSTTLTAMTLSIQGESTQKTITVLADNRQNHSGAIHSATEVWNADTVHHITGNLDIPSGQELIIQEGTAVVFDGLFSLTVHGRLTVEGSMENPVFFSADPSAEYWGNIEIINGEAVMTYTVLTGGGGDSGKVFGHSKSQPVILNNSGTLSLKGGIVMDSPGKAFGSSMGEMSLDSCFITRCDTGGEFDSSVVTITNTHVRDIPDGDGRLDDDDNDGFYFGGKDSRSEEWSVLKNSTIVCTEDDCVDHNGARLNVIGCILEGAAHEGVAASNADSIRVTNTVMTNCEQGIEAGYGSPAVFVNHCVVTDNDVGIRFGDNYDWGCSGHMTVTNTMVFGNNDNIKNFDVKTNGPIQGAVSISYSVTNDAEYDTLATCLTGTPHLDENYRLTDDSIGKGQGANGVDIGLVDNNISESVYTLAINELLAGNSAYGSDENGDFDDWVELYNYGSEKIDVGGMYISDDPATPKLWRIPDTNPLETTIEPGGLLLLWCDKETSQGVLHADLKLSGSGERIILYDENGALVDSCTFGPQQDNVSWGRTTDGAAQWEYFTEPTPGKSNNTSGRSPIKSFYITCNQQDFQYIYDNYEKDISLPATLKYGTRTWNDVKIRIRGESSREYPKKSLKVQFDTENFLRGRNEINLNSEYSDKSYIQQYLSSRLMQEAGVPCFDAEHVLVYLNGEFFGIYLNVEVIDNDFLNARGFSTDGNLYETASDGACLSIFDNITDHWKKENNSSTGTEDIAEFIEKLNSVRDENYLEFAQESIDYDRMVNIVMMNMLITNASTYYHNYYMYHNPDADNWIMFPWDMDKTLSAYGNNYPYLQTAWSNYRTQDNPFAERAFICDPIFQDVQNRLESFTQTTFNLDYITPIVDSLKTVLEPWIPQDDSDNISSISDWEKTIGYNIDYISKRPDILRAQFATWPRSFRLERPEKPFYDNVHLKWHPSIDPNGDAVTYELSYSNVFNFTLETTTTFSGLTDTTFTIPSVLPKGTYYWRVKATDGTNTVEGFDSRSMFTVAENTDTIIPSAITTDMKLMNASSPYYLSGVVTVAAGATLSSEPGVIIHCADSAALFVDGALDLEGTVSDPIVITAAENYSTFAGICFRSSSKQSHLVYTEIENAAGYPYDDSAASVVFADHTSLVIEDVTFSGVTTGIHALESEFIVRRCYFDDTILSDVIKVTGGSATIEQCTFDGCGLDPIDLNGVVQARITGCTINSSTDDGIDIGEESTDVLISDTVIHHAEDKAISIGQDSEATMERCILTTSKYGISVFQGSRFSGDHLTFYKNGTALYSDDSESIKNSITIYNSIFSSSKNEDYEILSPTTLEISYCLSDKELLAGDGNISGDPCFSDPDKNNFSLKTNSPAIDAGNPDDENDTDGTPTDMGAISSTFVRLVINEINYKSSLGSDWVELYNPSNNSINLAGWVFKDSNDSHEYIFDSNASIDARGYILLCKDQAAFQSVYPAVTGCYGDLLFGLSATGEQLRLFNSAGVLVDSLTYQADYPWPILQNQTLSLIQSHLDNAYYGNWRPSLGIGTPGSKNVVVAVDDTLKESILRQNYPNPFDISTTIPFELPERCKVTITVYTIEGRFIARLVDNYLDAGQHSVTFNAKNLSSGLLFYRIRANKSDETKQMVLIK